MQRKNGNRVKTRKLGAEDIIMIRIPADRFHNYIPRNLNPQTDEKSRYQIALLAQTCTKNSFDDEEAGPTDDFHFWLRLESPTKGGVVNSSGIMLPAMEWIVIAYATSNDTARGYLKTFGLSPLTLEYTNLKKSGGSAAFSHGGRIDWSIARGGRSLPSVGVNHELFVSAEERKSGPHRISAKVSNAVMDQLGKVRINTSLLEPFLLEGEQFAASISRMSEFRADVVWNKFI